MIEAHFANSIRAETVTQIGRCAEIGNAAITLEGVDRALTAIKDDLLFDGCNAVKFLISSADASLKADGYEKADINRIKAAVELNGSNCDASV